MEISPTALAGVLGRGQGMGGGVRPLWSPIPGISGPAFTVRCPPGDHLMLHAAIHRAEPRTVIVVESGDPDHALAGGNVCAVAQRRGIAGLVRAKQESPLDEWERDHRARVDRLLAEAGWQSDHS